MTSGIFTSVPIDFVWLDRADRQRKELRDIEELADSIRRLGLIHPLIIQRDGRLWTGERRFTAVKMLGWTDVPVQYVDDLDEYTLRCIEFEENVKRVDLTWQEQVLAIDQFHKLKAANEEEWTQESTADALGVSPTLVSRSLAVAKEMDNEKVATAERLSAAVNLVERSASRRRESALAGIAIPSSEVASDAAVQEAPPPPVVPLVNTSFHTWQESYDGPKFNLIHCDFPYGIDVAGGPRQNAALQDHYDDTPDVYWALVERLARAMSNVVADSAHLIFWFSMDYYADTVAELSRMGWKVNPFPLVWHKSDNSGIAPDPQRWPRRTYETALVASRGDRKLTHAGPRANSFAFPGGRDGHIHISEKPRPVLKHFLSMFCDEYSIVLDPTCGSGNALKVAGQLGAMSVLGLELSEEFYATAVANWSNYVSEL